MLWPKWPRRGPATAAPSENEIGGCHTHPSRSPVFGALSISPDREARKKLRTQPKTCPSFQEPHIRTSCPFGESRGGRKKRDEPKIPKQTSEPLFEINRQSLTAICPIYQVIDPHIQDILRPHLRANDIKGPGSTD